MESLIDTIKGAPRLVQLESFQSLMDTHSSGGLDVTSVIIGVKRLAKLR